MARVFADYKYELENGLVAFVRMKIAHKDALPANTEPAGSVDLNMRLDVSNPSRENGVTPRMITLVRSTGTGVNEVTYTTKMVKLARGTTIEPGTAVTIGGVNWTVGSVAGERSDTFRPLSAAT